MVLADAEPINRMSWRSTRRPGHPSDDEDRESVMLGGVRLRGGDDDNAPLALEDPWWSKLTGMPSSRPVHALAHSGCTCPRKVGPLALFMRHSSVRSFLPGSRRERGESGPSRCRSCGSRLSWCSVWRGEAMVLRHCDFRRWIRLQDSGVSGRLLSFPSLS